MCQSLQCTFYTFSIHIPSHVLHDTQYACVHLYGLNFFIRKYCPMITTRFWLIQDNCVSPADLVLTRVDCNWYMLCLRKVKYSRNDKHIKLLITCIIVNNKLQVVRLGSFQNLYLSFAIVEITHGVTANRDDTDFHHAKPQIL